MRRSTSSNNGRSPSKNAADLLSTMNSATQNNARVRSDLQSMQDKVDSARRHLDSHNRHFHAKGEDSSSGESTENRSPHHHSRSRSSHRDAKGVKIPSKAATRSKSREKTTPSVLYPPELKYVRRASREGGRVNRNALHDTTLRSSPAKSVSPTRDTLTTFDQSFLPDVTTSATSPRRRSTYVVSGRPRDSSFTLRGDSTFVVGGRRDSALIDRRDETTVSHEETVIAPGLLEEEYHPTSRKKQKTSTTMTSHGHGSTSVFHAKCTPINAHPIGDVSNSADWDVQFLPGSLKNARIVETNRRSAVLDLTTPSAESVLYQEERTKRQEEELKRLAREQMNGRSTREIFDSWVPLHEERRSGSERMEDEEERGRRKEERTKKSTRRLWESAERGGGILDDMERMEERGGRREEGRRVVQEDEAGYAMPLPRDVLHHATHADYRTPLDTTVPPVAAPRTPSPLVRGPTPEEQYFTPAATVKRLSRVGGEGEGGEWRDSVNETPILGRHSTRLSSTFVMEKSGRRLRGSADKEDKERSAGSSLWPTPDRREISIDGGGGNGSIEGGVNRPIGEYATPIGRRRGGGVEGGEQNSFLNASQSNSRTGLNESMHEFERSLNRSLNTLSDLATRLSSQLETSKANLSSMAPVAEEKTATPQKQHHKLEGVADDRRLGMEASILGSLPPMREGRQTTVGGGEELRRIMSSAERDNRSSLPEGMRRDEEGEDRTESPIPRPRTTVPPPPPSSSVHGLSSLLDASIGRMERSEQYEREAHRLERVVQQVNQTAASVEQEKGEKSALVPVPRTRPLTAAPLPFPRSRSPSVAGSAASAAAAAPMPQLAIDTAGGREELMEMYESRHRNWHRRGDDIALPSPRAAMSRSPSPLTLSNPAELRERQSKQGMLYLRMQAVRGAYLHLLRSLYQTRYDRRYEEKRGHEGDPVWKDAFDEEQKREVEAFNREKEEAKRRAKDETIKYRDFVAWLRDESEKMEKEIEFEVERRERKRWEREFGTQRRQEEQQSILDSSRFLEREKVLDERARRAMRATMAAQKYAEKRENVRRLEHDARRAVALAEIPSSARSSIDDASFLFNQSYRRYSIGNEPLRVTSARGETSMNASRDGRPLSRASSEEKEEERKKKEEDDKKKAMKELREKLEEKKRQAEGVRRAMEASQKELNESEALSVAAQLTAHDEYIQGVEAVGRVIGQSVQPRSPRGLPPGVEPLDLSSLEEEEGGKEREKKEEKRVTSSLLKSTGIEEGGEDGQRSPLSLDSLDAPSSSIPSKKSKSDSDGKTSIPPPLAPPLSSSSSYSSSASSNATLNAVDEISKRLEEITVSDREQQSTVEQKESIGEERPQFSPLRELDRSLPSTAASTGRQEITVDTVAPPQPTIDTVSVVPEEAKTVEEAIEQEPISEQIVSEEKSTVVVKPLFSPLESSTSVSEESSERSDTVVGRRKDTVEERKESIELTEVKGLSSSEEEEKERLDVSTASLKKAISVASEMADPFDGFESSSGSERKTEGVKQGAPVVQQPESAAGTAAPSTSATHTTSSTDQTTVVEAAKRDEVDEISWGGSDGGLEVGGGMSGRSADDFDWGSSLDEKPTVPKEEEKKGEEVEERKEKEEVTALHPVSSSESSSRSGEAEAEQKRGKFASLRDRLSKIQAEDEEDEKKSGKSVSSSTTSTSSSTAQSSSESTSVTSSSRSKSGEGTTEDSRSSGRESENKEEGEEGEKTPRIVSSGGASGATSSASGSVDFDDDVPLPVDSSRTPRAPSTRRFRLSLNDSFPDSPRDASNLPKSNVNGRVLSGGISPRGTPTSPHSPRLHLQHSTSLGSPSAHALSSPDGRKSRFSAVMPLSPRSGRRSTSPKSFSLSREASFLLDDSSIADVSRLSAVDVATSNKNGELNNLPPILSSLPPIITPSFPPISSSPLRSSPSQSMDDEEGVEMDDSVSFLMDVKPAASVLSSLPISELIGDTKNEEEEMELASPPPTVTARSSNGQLHEQCMALGKKEFIRPRIEREMEQIWKIVEQKGYYSLEDTKAFESMDFEDGEDEVTTLRNERILLIRGVCSEIASSLFARDLRHLKDGRSVPKELVPLRRLKVAPTKERLREAIEKKLLPDAVRRAEVPHVRRMRGLGIQFETLPPEDRILYTEVYSKEENLFNADAERLEILQIMMEAE